MRITQLAGRLAALLAALLLLSPDRAAAQDPLLTRALDALDLAEQQLPDSVAEIGDPARYPRSTDPATGLWTTRSAADWASGFFPGLLWLVHGVGDACQCGDQSGDGRVTPADVDAIDSCLRGALACAELCDGNARTPCDAADVTALQLALLGQGALRCARSAP